MHYAFSCPEDNQSFGDPIQLHYPDNHYDWFRPFVQRHGMMNSFFVFISYLFRGQWGDSQGCIGARKFLLIYNLYLPLRTYQ
jgi:hypothetical protein